MVLFRENGLGDDRIQFYAKAVAIAKLRAYEELYFYREHAEEWVQDLLGTRSKIAKRSFAAHYLGDDFKPL